MGINTQLKQGIYDIAHLAGENPPKHSSIITTWPVKLFTIQQGSVKHHTLLSLRSASQRSRAFWSLSATPSLLFLVSHWDIPIQHHVLSQ